MLNYQIVSDGSCDLSPEFVENNNLIVVPFYVSFEEGKYLLEGTDVKIRDFYQKMIDNPNVFPKSSMPSTQDYYNVFEKLVKDGKAVICLCITTKFSGSYNSAMTAKNMILDEYPEAKIAVVDTIINTVLQGLLVKEVLRMQKNGLDFDQVLENIERIKGTGRILFSVQGLDYLSHGGRIGKLTALIGNVIKINPLIVLRDGEIFSNGFALSRKRAIVKIREMFNDHFQKIGEKMSDYKIAVGYGYNIDEARDFKDKLVEQYNLEDVDFEQIGATISVHTGPHPIGIGLIKKYDK